MTRDLLLADKIMKEANDRTGWGFSIKSFKEGYIVGTTIESNGGAVLDIRFEVQQTEVTICTILSGLEFDEEKVKQELDLMGSTIEAIEISDEVVKLERKLSFIYARNCTAFMVVRLMMPMVEKMLNLIKNRIAA